MRYSLELQHEPSDRGANTKGGFLFEYLESFANLKQIGGPLSC